LRTATLNRKQHVTAFPVALRLSVKMHVRTSPEFTSPLRP